MSTPADTTDIAVEPEQVAEWLAAPEGSAEGDAAAAPRVQVAPRVQAAPRVQVIDVREPYEREAGHIAGTRHVEFASLTAAAATIERERPVVFYCRVGSRSDVAAQAFRGAGYQAYSMSGGLVRWAQEGRPLSPADGHVADH
ncbi:MAG TPA: rhodanese-like domain-containing protein [Solirubrobacteraceae bacterium]|nr:rhodanese-like domain-containing protein [Solirubrobacteraceae bacterium]